MKHRCEGCGGSFDPAAVTMFQMVTGWVRVMPRSTQVRGRRYEQRFVCRPCLEGFERAGTEWEQPQLWETP